MPFRHWDLCNLQRRTGEPSPATPLERYQGYFKDVGWGKAKGSYTEAMRKAFDKWRDENLGSPYSPITFQYRLSRKKIITVNAQGIYIKHYPGYGKRGFVLVVTSVLSIDGVPLGSGGSFINKEFLMSRIMGSIPTKMLMSGGR